MFDLAIGIVIGKKIEWNKRNQTECEKFHDGTMNNCL